MTFYKSKEQGAMALNWCTADFYYTEILHCESGEALEQVAQRSYGCPIPGNGQGQVGCSFQQPGLVSLPMAWELELDDL